MDSMHNTPHTNFKFQKSFITLADAISSNCFLNIKHSAVCSQYLASAILCLHTSATKERVYYCKHFDLHIFWVCVCVCE